ncbi:MAG: hypothetical protein K0R39_296 [Symbiobacteriaceae bacterium]|jgi:spore coat protein B|nr:hypothetical protein [Symbiobacteriaceae bacterium]
MRTLFDYLNGLVGTYVQVERGGPDACQGWFASAQDDYLTIVSGTGDALHLPLRHVRSITPVPPPTDERRPAAYAVRPPTFLDLLLGSVGQVVRIYHAGPEVSVGTLREATQDFLLLEDMAGDIVCYFSFHVRSLYVVPRARPSRRDISEVDAPGR